MNSVYGINFQQNQGSAFWGNISSESQNKVRNDYAIDLQQSRMPSKPPIGKEFLYERGGARVSERKTNYNVYNILGDYESSNKYKPEWIENNPDEAQAVLQDAIVERASGLLAQDSPLTREWLSEHIETARALVKNPSLAEYLNSNPDQVQRLVDNSDEAQAVLQGAIVERASGLLAQDSLLTKEWLSEHIETARALVKNPSLAEYLNSNPDQVQRLVDNPDEAQAVLQDAIVERASGLLAQDSLLTKEWLSEHIETARALVKNPSLAEYLNSNPDQVQRLVDNSDEAQAVLQDAIVERASGLLAQDSLLTKEWLSEHIETARALVKNPSLAEYLNSNPDQVQRLVENPDEAQAVLQDAIVERASVILGQDSVFTEEWLSGHLRVARFIATHPGVANYINSNEYNVYGNAHEGVNFAAKA